MNRRTITMQRPRGFSLIEVLVSVVIMSVGILGVAGLQVVSLQQNRNSLLRAEALLLANDMLDRMRANPLQDYAGIDFADTPQNATDCTTSNCSAANMREFDISQWQCSLNSTAADGTTYPICNTFGIAGALPEGEGAIVDNTDDTLCAVDADEVCVIVRWTDGPDGGKGSVSVRTRVD